MYKKFGSIIYQAMCILHFVRWKKSGLGAIFPDFFVKNKQIGTLVHWTGKRTNIEVDTATKRKFKSICKSLTTFEFNWHKRPSNVVISGTWEVTKS